jgi:TM2 domain-containing membrane protein YozV
LRRQLFDTTPQLVYNRHFLSLTGLAMTVRQKNKTLTTLFAVSAGSIGAHRFYLHGWGDKWGWLHFSSLPLSLIISHLYIGTPALFSHALLVTSFLIAILEALIIGLTPDEKWDARYHPDAGRITHSNWPLALLLVLTVGIGAIALIAVIARTFDLLYTGGSYG